MQLYGHNLTVAFMKYSCLDTLLKWPQIYSGLSDVQLFGHTFTVSFLICSGVPTILQWSSYINTCTSTSSLGCICLIIFKCLCYIQLFSHNITVPSGATSNLFITLTPLTHSFTEVQRFPLN